MRDLFNPYGDQFKPVQAGYGTDISSQRQDALDLHSLDFIRECLASQKIVQAVELGGGFGAHTIQMAAIGAHVTMVDIADTAKAEIKKSVEAGILKAENIRVLLKDFTTLRSDDIPLNYDLLYSQRAINYVPYLAAKKVLQQMFVRMKKGGAIFISAAGWDTEYGKTFPDRNLPITQRYNFVSPDMQKKHNMLHKIVTYTKEEMAVLLKEVGFSDIQVSVSPFGNIKAMARNLG